MNNLLGFKERLKENKSVEELRSSEGTVGYVRILEGMELTSSFHMTASFNTIMSKHITLIDLDEEDLEYFKKKYLTKEFLREEMEKEIETIKVKYN